jgi:tripartite ATP-independent transporter DctM subunit
MIVAVSGEMVAIAMVLITFAVLMLGFPVAFSLAGSAIILAGVGSWLDVFTWPLLASLMNRIYGIMISPTLVAVPLFVFMGVMLEKSRIAENLLETMGQLFRARPGGLGISIIVVGAMLAASTGIVGATVVTMGLISLPAMLRAGYDKGLASGIICSSGALAQIIPPSTVLILLSHQIQGSYMEASMAMGNFAAAPVSTADLFAGAIVPGLILVAIYTVVVLAYAVFRPEACPPVRQTIEGRELAVRVAKSMVPPLVLIGIVLGSILTGAATASESASVGAVGATLLAIANRRLDIATLREVCRSALRINTMIFAIIIGATIFSLVFRGLGGEELAEDLLSLVPGGLVGATLVVLAIVFFLGFFLDTFEIIFIATPIFTPILFQLGADPIFIGVAMGLVLQAAYLTPPFGFSIFYLQGVTNKLQTTTIYKGLIPFIAIQVLIVLTVVIFPGLVTWLPGFLFAK